MRPADGDRLTAVDTSFLIEERLAPAVHAGVGVVYVFEGKPPTYTELIALLDKRLPHMPRLRQRVVPEGSILRPRWRDDPYFDVHRHVEVCELTSLTDRDLQRLAGGVYSRRLPRDRPLWQMALFHTPHAPRFAVVLKVHHTLADGVTLGQYVSPALFGVADHRPPTGMPVAQPRFRLLDGAFAVAEAAWAHRAPAPRSPLLNRPVGDSRRLAWTRLELHDMREVRAALGGTINDVYLTCVAAAIRALYLRHRRHPAATGAPFAFVPVSTRTPAEHALMGNRMSEVRVRLPIETTDSVERYRKVTSQMRRIKGSRQARGATLVGVVDEFVPAAALPYTTRIHTSTRLFNLVVSNIHGPTAPLALGGRPLAEMQIVNFLPPRCRLCLTMMSYLDAAHFVVLSDQEAADDGRYVCDQVRLELLKIVSAVRGLDAPDGMEAAIDMEDLTADRASVFGE